MPNLRTSDEAPATLPLTGAELVRIVQAGGNARATTANIAALATPTAANVSYAGIGGRTRTSQDKMDDWKSLNDFSGIDPSGATDCTAAVIAGFAAAYAGGYPLLCPGIYKVSGTVAHFHDVVKYGLGKFVNGSNTFWVSILSSQTNNLYVDPAGNDSNDGLTAAQPLLTLQKTVDTIAKYGPYLNGQWVGNAAAGTYTNGATIPSGLSSLNYIHFAGPTGTLPFVPTFIIDGTSATTTFAFNQAGNSAFLLTDCYIKNFSTGKFGTVAQLFGSTYYRNVYTFNCDQPCKVQQGRMLVEGGVFVAGTNGSQGLLAISGETHSIGYQATSAGSVTNAVTGCSGTGTTATITFSALASAPIVGSTLAISGMTPTAYNGVWIVTASSTTSASFLSTATGSMTVAGRFGYNFGCAGYGPLVYGFSQTNILIQENATGHVDFTASEGGGIPCDIVANSRVNANSSSFTGAAGQGVRYRDAEFVRNNSVFAGNVLDEQAGAFSVEIGRQGLWISELRQPTDQVSVANTGSTTVNTLKTYASAIKANSYNSSVKSYRGEVFGTKTGTAGTAVIAVTIGGTTVCSYTIPAAATQWSIEFLFAARNATSQRIRCKAFTDSAFLGVQVGSGALSVITGADLPMVITCQNNNAGDTITLLEVDQWSSGAC